MQAGAESYASVCFCLGMLWFGISTTVYYGMGCQGIFMVWDEMLEGRFASLGMDGMLVIVWHALIHVCRQ